MAYEISLDANTDRLKSKLAGVFDDAMQRADQLMQKVEGSRARVSGPYTRLEASRSKLESILASGGSEAEVADARYAAQRAERSVARIEKAAQPKTRAEAISDLLMTSRISISDGGVSMMPLVNRMMGYRAATGLFGEGIGGAISSMAPAIAGVTAAIYGMTAAANAYSGYVRETAAAYYIGGGGSSGAASMMNMGLLTGMSGGDMARRAVQFGDFLRGGGPAAGYFRSRGLVDRGWFQTDKTSNFSAAARMIMDPNTPEDMAIRLARYSGMEDFLQKRDMSPGLRDEMLGTFAEMNGADRRNAVDYQARLDLMEGKIRKNVTHPLGRMGLNWLEQFTRMPSFAESVFGNVLGGAIDQIASDIRGGGGSNPNSATNKLSQAADQLADAGRTLKESAEQIGGGPRARAAIPGGMLAGIQVLGMDASVSAQAAALGAFTI